MKDTEIRAKIADVEDDYADVLNMTAEEISTHERTVYWTSKRARAIGLLDAYHSVLNEEIDNSRYPCMANWREAAAAAGQWPWRQRFERLFWKRLFNESGGPGKEPRKTPRDIILEPGFPLTRQEAGELLEEWDGKGWYTYGVSLELGWLTDEGLAVGPELD